MSETGSVSVHFIWSVTDLSGGVFSEVEVDKPAYLPRVGQQVRHASYQDILGIVLRLIPPLTEDDDNSYKLKVLWSSPVPGETFQFPQVRKVFPALVANELVSVQPMTLPSGLVFYLDYTYNSGSTP